VVSVDWDTRSLRVTHALLGKRGVKIDRLLSVAMPPEVDPTDAEQLGRHIRRTLDQEGISTRQAVVDIPRDQAILKTLQLPTTQPDELPGMVEIQIAKELPFPVSEAVIDFAIGPRLAQEDTPRGEVLVAAIRRELLEQYSATFHAAGLRLERIGLRPYANKVAVCEMLRHAMPERVLFIDVRPTFMEIDVLRDGALAFSRSASVTIPDGLGESAVLSLAAAERDDGDSGADEARESPRLQSVIHGLVLEVTRSIEAYRAGDHGATIDHVVIAGDVGVEDALAEAIQKRLNLTTEMYNPAGTFGWAPDEGAGAAAFAASLGLVIGHVEDGAEQLNFLAPKKTVSATEQRLKKAPIAAAVVVLFAAAAAVAFAAYTKSDREQLAALEQRIDDLRERQGANKKFLEVVEEIEAFDEGQCVWVDLLYEVIALLPDNEELLVNNVDMNQKERRITLKTRAKRRETATEVIHGMEAYRRDGRDKQRFRVSMGPQTQRRDEYPFSQDLRVWILDDEPDRKESSRP
jgi:type IV pilus assembly protein PilM